MRKRSLAIAMAMTLGLSGIATAMPVNANASELAGGQAELVQEAAGTETEYDTQEPIEYEDVTETDNSEEAQEDLGDATEDAQPDQDTVDKQSDVQSGEAAAEVQTTNMVRVNASNFPDENFRKYLSEEFDKDNDGWIDAGSITEMDCRSREIRSLEGIEYFPNLSSLNCSTNDLEELDISKNKALTKLFC